MKTRFDLEQEIMDCWTMTDAVKDVYEALMDSERFEGMNPKHQDELANLLLGIYTLYDLKFDRTFKTFESQVKQGKL